MMIDHLIQINQFYISLNIINDFNELVKTW